jgi:cobalt-zinc-cadmium efflux system outer membrane protein
MIPQRPSWRNTKGATLRPPESAGWPHLEAAASPAAQRTRLARCTPRAISRLREYRVAAILSASRGGNALDAGTWYAPCGIALLLLVAGCAQYRPLPLDEAAVERALTPPETAALQIQAEALRHPILRPMQLNLQNGLSPEEAAVLAVLLNPSLRAVRDGRALADAQLLRAGLLPNPELSLDFETPIGGDTAEAVNAFGLGLNWNVATLLSRPADVQGAQARRAAVEMDVAWQEWQVARDARAAVFQLAGLEQQVGLRQETVQSLQQNVERIRQAVTSGTQTAKELSATEAQSRKAHAALLELRQQTARQRYELNRLLGLPPEHRVHLKEIELPSSFEPPAGSALLAGLDQRRLDLVALRRGYDSQEAAVRAAILRQFPRLSLGPTVGRDVENVDTAGFGLAVDLPVFSRNQGAITVEQATRQKLFDEYVNRVFEARSDIAMLLSRIRFLNEEIAAALQAEPELQKLVETYRTALTAARVDILTYYAAWNDMTSNRLNRVVLQGQLAQAVVDLEAAAGRYDLKLMMDER